MLSKAGQIWVQILIKSGKLWKCYVPARVWSRKKLLEACQIQRDWRVRKHWDDEQG